MKIKTLKQELTGTLNLLIACCALYEGPISRRMRLRKWAPPSFLLGDAALTIYFEVF